MINIQVYKTQTEGSFGVRRDDYFHAGGPFISESARTIQSLAQKTASGLYSLPKQPTEITCSYDCDNQGVPLSPAQQAEFDKLIQREFEKVKKLDQSYNRN